MFYHLSYFILFFWTSKTFFPMLFEFMLELFQAVFMAFPVVCRAFPIVFIDFPLVFMAFPLDIAPRWAAEAPKGPGPGGAQPRPARRAGGAQRLLRPRRAQLVALQRASAAGAEGRPSGRAAESAKFGWTRWRWRYGRSEMWLLDIYIYIYTCVCVWCGWLQECAKVQSSSHAEKVNQTIFEAIGPSKTAISYDHMINGHFSNPQLEVHNYHI